MTALTPDQLHRLIDEVAELAYRESAFGVSLDVMSAYHRAGCAEESIDRAIKAYVGAGYGFAGLSAVLILLSEGG